MVGSRSVDVTKSDLTSDLQAIGVEPGQTIMLHVSVRAIGWIIGGPHVLIDAILACVGDSGTLMMYAAWEERPEHFERWSEERKRAFLRECPPFVPERSRANRKWSILTEYLRTWPGACRSGNPGASMVAVGARAGWLTADHSLQYGYGPRSPLGRLCEVDGRVLQIGVSPQTATLIHHAEHLARLPDKRKFTYTAPLLREGEVRWVRIEDPHESVSRCFIEAGCSAFLLKNASRIRRFFSSKFCSFMCASSPRYRGTCRRRCHLR